LLRGAYLVQGLGHCSACHSARNALGASNPLDLAGGLIPMQNWYAPSLTDARQAGLMDWPLADIVALMQTGVSPRGSVQGPMAEVVLHSTQHLSQADLQAMATYLKALPASPRPPPPARLAQANAAGAALYDKHCVQCHGAQGQGVSNAYPALAGNRAVTMDSTVNLVQMVLHGGYPPATAGNPRPYGMPPYWVDLSEQDIADLLNHLRSSWGHSAGAVSAVDVHAARSRR
jgi:mono/diheme cytochrome c family protein